LPWSCVRRQSLRDFWAEASYAVGSPRARRARAAVAGEGCVLHLYPRFRLEGVHVARDVEVELVSPRSRRGRPRERASRARPGRRRGRSARSPTAATSLRSAAGATGRPGGSGRRAPPRSRDRTARGSHTGRRTAGTHADSRTAEGSRRLRVRWHVGPGVNHGTASQCERVEQLAQPGSPCCAARDAWHRPAPSSRHEQRAG